MEFQGQIAGMNIEAIGKHCSDLGYTLSEQFTVAEFAAQKLRELKNFPEWGTSLVAAIGASLEQHRKSEHEGWDINTKILLKSAGDNSLESINTELDWIVAARIKLNEHEKVATLSRFQRTGKVAKGSMAGENSASVQKSSSISITPRQHAKSGCGLIGRPTSSPSQSDMASPTETERPPPTPRQIQKSSPSGYLDDAEMTDAEAPVSRRASANDRSVHDLTASEILARANSTSSSTEHSDELQKTAQQNASNQQGAGDLDDDPDNVQDHAQGTTADLQPFSSDAARQMPPLSRIKGGSKCVFCNGNAKFTCPCMTAVYCGKTCQFNHWVIHAGDCEWVLPEQSDQGTVSTRTRSNQN